MQRISSLTSQLTSTKEKKVQNIEEILGESIIFKSSNLNESILKKIKYSLPFAISYLWIGGPLLGAYLMKIGNFEKRLDLLLILAYQYFFFKKTTLLRNIYRIYPGYKYFNNFRIIVDDPENIKGFDSEKCLFAFQPHGIVVAGMGLTVIAMDYFKNCEVVGSSGSYLIPWGGLIMKLYGVEGAFPANFKRLMQEKKNICFVPGGFEEATITDYGKDKIFIKNRKGFIKMALQYGYKVFPVYTFGENKLFYTFTNEKVGLFLNKFKLPGTLMYSNNFLIPNNDLDINTVIGKGIKIPLIKDPSNDNIDFYHNEYVKELLRMYDKYKLIFGANESLTIL